MQNSYDIVIIGAGVSGASCARELSRYRLNILVIDKEADVCCGTSKANSAIVHSGIDCKPGTLMAKLNVRGNELMEPLSRELDFEFDRNGSLILCFDEEDRPRLQALYEQGIENGVPGLRIVESDELHEMEPNVSKDAVAAIWCPTGGIVWPFGMNIAMAENAYTNGVSFCFNTEVSGIDKEEDGYCLHVKRSKAILWTDGNTGEPLRSSLPDGEDTVRTRCVINAAGVYADQIHNMVSGHKIHITPRRGEYCLMDKGTGDIVHSTIFQLPTPKGKGILVTPTIHGNLLIGPTATDTPDREGTCTTQEGLDTVMQKARLSVPSVPTRQIITSFAGLRAHEDGHEFLIGELEDAPFFIDCAGIESPGLTSAPAIGEMVCEIAAGLLNAEPDPSFNGTRKGIIDPKKLDADELSDLIRRDPAYAAMVCRCEMVTEGEIIDAITRPLGAHTLDGVKQRTRAGMGRCQAGFCTPKTMELLSRLLGIPMTEITKNGPDSLLLTGMTDKASSSCAAPGVSGGDNE